MTFLSSCFLRNSSDVINIEGNYILVSTSSLSNSVDSGYISGTVYCVESNEKIDIGEVQIFGTNNYFSLIDSNGYFEKKSKIWKLSH